jgi:hypothetical protein
VRAAKTLDKQLAISDGASSGAVMRSRCRTIASTAVAPSLVTGLATSRSPRPAGWLAMPLPRMEQSARICGGRSLVVQLSSELDDAAGARSFKRAATSDAC